MAAEGFAATTLAAIGQKAGVSPGLIAHYFVDKDGLLEATLRSLAARLALGLSKRLRLARTPRERVQAVIDTTLAAEEFDARTCSVWLAFWGQVLHSARLKRVQKVYQGRLLSNLRHGLKQIVPAAEADRIAHAVAAMIDGLWLGAALSSPKETTASLRARRRVRSSTRSSRDAPPSLRSRRKAKRASATISAVHMSMRRSARRSSTSNPATGEKLAEVEIAGAAEVDAAVAAAKRGQAVWAAMTGLERGRVMKRAADILRARNAELAHLETLDTGKPIQETSVVDVISGADCLDYFAGLAGGLAGEHIDLGPSAMGYTRREPLGIVAGIGAWNYPIQIACWKSAPALACGNAMIFKPAELTRLAPRNWRKSTRKRGCPMRVQRRARARRHRPAADAASGNRQGFADRRGVNRQGRDGRRIADVEARHAGARRQVTADRVRGCRPRRCRIGRAAGEFLFPPARSARMVRACSCIAR